MPGRFVALPLALTLALALAGCAGPAAKAPAPPTVESVRALTLGTRTADTLAAVSDPRTRAVIAGWFEQRSAIARQRGRVAILETVAIGETMSIGGGLSLVRAFALWHEQEADHFTSWLSGLELIGDRLQSRHDQAVGRDAEALARLDFAELNRVVIRRYTFAPGDKPCCPTVERRIGFQLNPNGLDRLE
jgi:hypothetical protein